MALIFVSLCAWRTSSVAAAERLKVAASISASATSSPSGGTTILEAIRQTVAPGANVTFSRDGSGLAGADAVIVVVGELPYAEMKGDRDDLSLAAVESERIHRAKLAGVPVITILISGRPLILGASLDESDAFLAAWLPGTEGLGIADVLFGDYHPTGKLSRHWPANMKQVPTRIGAEPSLFPD